MRLRQSLAKNQKSTLRSATSLLSMLYVKEHGRPQARRTVELCGNGKKLVRYHRYSRFSETVKMADLAILIWEGTTGFAMTCRLRAQLDTAPGVWSRGIA